ncbi:MAG: hypothetical protein AAF985_27410 [Bacteroidota bacterium]
MQQYVEQLLSDIRELTRQTPLHKRIERAFLDEDIEKLLKKACYKPLEVWIGMPKISFPSEARLSFTQARAILEALVSLLDRHGFRVSFPQKAPINLRYQTLIDYLDQPTPRLESHYWQLSICGYDPGKCRYGKGYCQCLAWEDILNEIPKQKTSQLVCKIIDLPPQTKQHSSDR